MTDSGFSHSSPFTIAELEKLYYEVVLQQSFYDENYGSEWSEEPYKDMAEILHRVLKPRSHVDVGCGKGLLVLAMRRLGLNSFGIDFSEALVRQVPREIRQFVQTAKAEDWTQSAPVQEADLITFMEVFEHLPFALCASILDALRESYRGRVLVTTPSYGVDDRWSTGIRTNEGTASWREDMAMNRPFREIVLHHGMPHHGHISLASYRWWTEFFLLHGWTRLHDLETAIIQNHRRVVVWRGWSPYVLGLLPVGQKHVVLTEQDQLGEGWYAVETFGPSLAGRWSNGYAQVFFRCGRTEFKALFLDLVAPEANVIKEFRFSVTLDVQVFDEQSYRLTWIPLAYGGPREIHERMKLARMRLELQPVIDQPPDPETDRVYRLTLISPSFSPSRYGLSQDDRTLGIFVSAIDLEC